MKTAKFNNAIIHINQINRELYQSIYENGKKGKLHCPACGKPVRFYIGIEKDPYFYHIHKEDKKCEDPPNLLISKTKEQPEYKEQNGFRIPKSRSVTAENSPGNTYKKAQTLKIQTPFIPAKRDEMNESFQYLNDLKEAGVVLDLNQAKAVSRVNGPLLVLAGAGSGKTRVLTARTAFMISEHKIDPRSILLVTFTAKAASEMKKRLITYPNIDEKKSQQIVSGTFHSLFYRILVFHSPQEWSADKLLSKGWQRDQLIKQAGRTLNLDEKEFAFDLALQQISFWKNSIISPDQIRPESAWEEQVALLYQLYEQEKKKNEWFDFDDMLLGCYTLFQNEPDILAKYQKRFQYFLIDEFQDINKIQYELIKMMSALTQNVCAVGDDDQSIYAFRGSTPQYLLDFEKDFSTAEIVILSQNYRSSHEIVSTANEVIKQNKNRHAKNMQAQASGTNLPVVFYPYDEEEEATAIVTDIQEKMAEGFQPNDIVVLFRTNTGSRAIFERLTNSSLPFRIEMDAESFYDRFIVKSILSFLQLSINEDHQDAIKNILPALFVKQAAMKDLIAESILKDCSLLECLKYIKTGFSFQENKLRKSVKVIQSLSKMSPVSAIEVIEKELGFQDFVKNRGSDGNKMEKGSDDLKDLKVAARNFTSIEDLLNHADHMRAMNKEMKAFSKKNQNAISLSTIHRAKGLEYKVVYLLGVVDGNLPHDYALEAFRNGDSSTIEEERRLLYVAITRAMEYLYISIPDKRRGKQASPSRFLSGIPRQTMAMKEFTLQ
ncbi:UvrD-helicase domain-containing protein [Bacillus sp. DTU_2020_1000418_1_SI_GHA_SEK_038]|uniref:UvrD-helicase domain-containing protein n=1 Tax=Bacillus sp. DTU_2020_1000418_1_SI_GHA_SEK_038 TaxID=3077585 RepID=UPI0028E9387E|nr:UvrD-helicase domain-containing protein [Bacillus sp. DTU_2020_1000418_1_SI_GHA_SEK_038]WNS76897.1 UvrD-helicase domain-containing protein [Bacillus sp. DTU_2020_1000418_1_SI_GHA_SEK_038]